MATTSYQPHPNTNTMPSQHSTSDSSHHDYEVGDADRNYSTNDVQKSRNPAAAYSVHQGNSVMAQGRPAVGSFSARAQNRPEGDLIRPDESLTSIQGYSVASAEQIDGNSKATSPIDASSQPSPLSRSNTTKSSTDKRRDWASDRSPLQKLEVTLNGISKEEKRARVLEAERRVKERLARQQREAETRDASAARPPDRPSNTGSQSNATRQKSTSERDARQLQPDTASRQVNPAISRGTVPDRHEMSIPREQRAPGQPKQAIQNRGPPSQPIYMTENSPHSSLKSPMPVVSQGSVPRRSVSVNQRPGGYADGAARNPELPREKEIHTRTTPEAIQTPRPPQQNHPIPQQVRILPRQAYPESQIQQSQSSQRAPERNIAFSSGMNAQQDRNHAGTSNGPADTPVEPIQDELNAQMKPKKNTVSFNVPPPTPPPLSEWKNAPVARLGASDFDFQHLDTEKSKAWWEGGGSNRRKSRALPSNYQKPAQKLTENKSFQPPLFLKCGPLLRYTGLKRVSIDGPNGPFDKETWRGSILIVTRDSRSSYDSPPSLKLFSQPMDLLPPPPVTVSGAELAPEYIDPTAGLMKLGRDGRPLYVKPVDHTEEGLDLSFVENDDGIYELSASMVDYSSEGIKQPIPANRLHSVDGETAGAFKEVVGARLYADPARDVTFWRFAIEIELGPTQQRIAYRLNHGPALGFWVPARGQSMNIMFHTCNGFSLGVDSNMFCGPDPLWRDVLNEHQTRPFHVMIGGGDQIFNDRVMFDSPHFQEWMRIKGLSEKYDTAFDPEFRAEIESFYLENYSAWFSQGLFSLANSQIPMVNMWNDHEIIEGYGSYPDEFMGAPVMSGLGRIAFKYYLLFQHHSVPEETEADEPSWLLGAQPGPYINYQSRHVFMSLGKEVAFLGLDCRTERLSDEVLSEQTCDMIWDRCHREIVRGETKHLIVLSSVPIAYPRMAMLKNIINSRKSLGKAGLFGGLVNKNGGKVEIFDDHWTAKHHKSERTYLIEDLQDLAAEKSVRVTILSGDVHLAAIGQFYSNAKLNVPKDKDYRYMPNVISSAIADMPETEMVSDMLNKRNHVHHVDTNTDEDMIPIFTQDVNSKPRNNKRLLPRRNWCAIREFQPGSTPPDTPELEQAPVPMEEPRPRKLQRTLSLGRGDRPQGGLLRRLSLRGPPPTKEFNLDGAPGRHMSMDGPFPTTEAGNNYFPPAPADFRPGPFHRRPTNLSQKAAKKAAKKGDDGVGSYINLEGGLAITLNLELNPQDPSGITTPYKLLVPMLRYDGTEYEPPATPVAKGWKRWLSVKRKKEPSNADDAARDAEDTDYSGGDYDEYTESDPDEPDPRMPQSMGAMGQTPAPGAISNGSEEGIKPKKKWFGRLG
ncbi:uncharacterized protein ACLA_051980 [Aspergillus clavatus NRRL 1]|uniref:PhoD-like phosphatase domain-containing protein n=1 Tax=Aspergillus clavatus (strain ATCC 1007 / CBS 513.65 / DSM 816 / NCTC 3887 / NRRL 1 / QM 1276 / 107) TaxID=344612 RepID=A1CIM1_ASPCL|nr:uncharacterized protein ACLA_051980 [Aspergillus clavatus NRRL 1]EAW10726.1 conserved hypothetical protein [Aspergillus clavatus NRRL 1]